MNRYTINVLQEDINKGRQARAESCPIALAIKRTLPEIRSVTVTGYDALIIRESKRSWLQRLLFAPKDYDMLNAVLPKEASIFVKRFDGYGASAVKPFSFELSIV